MAWKVFLELDVAQARATNEDDLHQILSDIKSDIGINRMNHELKDALVCSAVAEVPAQAGDAADEGQGGSGGGDLGGLIRRAALLCQLYGRFSEAEGLYRRDLALCERLLGSEHQETMACIQSLAGLLRNQGRYLEAEVLYRRAFEGNQRSAGDEHQDTLNTLNEL